MKRAGTAPGAIPFREWLMSAGQLGWSPETFWRTPFADFKTAVEGFNRAQRAMSGQPEPMSREEAEEIWAADERRVARLRANGG